MKKRVLSAVILLPLLLAVVLAAPKIMTAVLLGFMCAIAAYELLAGTKLVRNPELLICTMAAAFLVPFWCYYGMNSTWGLLGVYIFFTLLVVAMMLSHIKIRFEKIAVCLAGGLLVPYLLSSLVRLVMDSNGRFYVLIPFVIAFSSDTGAYFIGRKFGRHKLAPVISPKKSVEGLVGGLVAAVVGMMIYGLVLDHAFDFQINYLYIALYGVVGCFAGVFGDLTFSVIKRQTGIKDYGNLIPGHGGILDRFDSVMLVAPLVEVLLALLPMVVK